MRINSVIWAAAALGGALLSSSLASAHRTRHFGDARRDYYKRAEIEAENRNAKELELDARAPNSYRFLNSKSKKYKVDSLPLIRYPLGEFYSGTIPIDYNDPSRVMFFVFQPTLGAPVDEVTIWFNGGPGCSSLEGFLQENGYFQWSWGMYSPIRNEYSWVNLTNMLWVEYPVGVGFSTGKVTATTEEETAQDFIKFFKNFEKIFGIKNFKIYVTGESYAGRYVPYVSAAMLDQKDTEYYHLKGALTYDPCIGQFEYSGQNAGAVPHVLANANLYNFNASFTAYLQRQHEYCGFANFTDYYMQFPASGIQPVWNTGFPENERNCDLWQIIYNEAYRGNPCFNPYEANLMCPILFDPLGFPSDLIFNYPGNTVYFNRKDVKEAMHAPADVEWSECSGPVFKGTGGIYGLGDTSLDPIQKVLPQVIEATNRVLVANGDFDFEIITNGTLLSIQNMTWNGKLGFQKQPSRPIDIKLPDKQYRKVFDKSGLGGLDGPGQGIMGISHYERGLMWAQTYQSGHMEPQFQARSSYRHLQWLLGHIEEL